MNDFAYILLFESDILAEFWRLKKNTKKKLSGNEIQLSANDAYKIGGVVIDGEFY